MPDNTREKKECREAQSPETRHRGDGPSACGITGAGSGIVNRENTQARGPSHIDNGGVANQKMNEPEDEHHTEDDGRSSQPQMYGFLQHQAASPTRGIFRATARRSAGVRTA